jgi:hypothetical protein
MHSTGADSIKQGIPTCLMIIGESQVVKDWGRNINFDLCLGSQHTWIGTSISIGLCWGLRLRGQTCEVNCDSEMEQLLRFK